MNNCERKEEGKNDRKRKAQQTLLQTSRGGLCHSDIFRTSYFVLLWKSHVELVGIRACWPRTFLPFLETKATN